MRQGESSPPAIALLAEASSSIGTGHAFEAFALARASQDRGVAVELWMNSAAPEGLRDMAPIPPRITPDFSIEGLAGIAESIAAREFTLAVTNFRRTTNQQVQALQGRGIHVVVTDEWGNTRLDCPVVVNTSIVKEYHTYESNHPSFRLYSGPEYLPLSREYQRLHEMPRQIAGPIQQIVVAMGGTDRTGGTLPIVESLLGRYRDIDVHIVAGPAFGYLDQLYALLGNKLGHGFQVYRDLPGLAGLFSQCDVGFSMGGDTLYEMACVGTPAIVLYEEEHERMQGMAFQEHGAAFCLSSTVEAEPSQIRAALEALEDPQRRREMSNAGRSLVDGRGSERTLAVVLAMASPDPIRAIRPA